MSIQFHQEFLEGEDPEQDIHELNRTSNKQMYTSNAIKKFNFSKNLKDDLETDYEKIIKKYEDHFNPKEIENYNKGYDEKFVITNITEDPLTQFEKLCSEVELIEKDLKYYSENKDAYKSIAPIETSLEELEKLKYIISCINSSKDFEKLKKIKEIKTKNGININEDEYNLLNKKLYTNLEEELNQRLNNMKKLKTENPMNYKNIEYELFLTPDKEKMMEYKQLDEIVLKVNEIEKKIGKWNFSNKKNI